MSEARGAWCVAMRRQLTVLCLCFGLAFMGAASVPHPATLTPQAWRLLFVFGGLIAALSLGIRPGIAALVAWVACALSGSFPALGERSATAVGLAGFSQPVMWLILVAFFMSQALRLSGLGERMALLLVARIGTTPRRLLIALGACDFLLSPFIPSNTARGAGTMLPVTRALLEALRERVGEQHAQLGSYLSFGMFQLNALTSALFMTAMAANPVAAQLASDLGVELSYLDWFLAASVPSCAAIFLASYVLSLRFGIAKLHLPDAPTWARQQLEAKGALSRHEWTTVFCFVVTVVLWVGGKALGIDSTVAALVGLCLLVVSGALSWDDVSSDAQAWDTFLWFAIVLNLAALLGELGVLRWGADQMVAALGAPPVWLVTPLIVLLYVVAHYGFVSQTAHVVMLYGVFLSTGITLGADGWVLALQLAFASNYMGSATTYGSSVAPPFLGMGFVSQRRWLGEGSLMLLMCLGLYLGVGSLWLGLLRRLLH